MGCEQLTQLARPLQVNLCQRETLNPKPQREALSLWFSFGFPNSQLKAGCTNSKARPTRRWKRREPRRGSRGSRAGRIWGGPLKMIHPNRDSERAHSTHTFLFTLPWNQEKLIVFEDPVRFHVGQEGKPPPPKKNTQRKKSTHPHTHTQRKKQQISVQEDCLGPLDNESVSSEPKDRFEQLARAPGCGPRAEPGPGSIGIDNGFGHGLFKTQIVPPVNIAIQPLK